MALHETSVGKTDEWYTPGYVFDALGCRYDVDVSAPFKRDYVFTPADKFIIAGSLAMDWEGFVWMNPPFGGRNGIKPWLKKFFEHGNGIALTPDRTSAPWWCEYSKKADLVLFVSPKIAFIDINGLPQTSPPNGTTLFASGIKAVTALYRAARNGLGNTMVPLDGLPSVPGAISHGLTGVTTRAAGESPVLALSSHVSGGENV